MNFDAFAALPQEEEDHIKIVTFMLGQVQCAVDIMAVREIINPVSMVSVPEAPVYVIGAADHREIVLPVIDLKLIFKLPSVESSRKNKWIIADANGLFIALFVDTVNGVITVNQKQRREPHPIISGTDISWVKEVYGGDNGLIFVLDLDKILFMAPPAEMPHPQLSGDAQ